MDPHKLAYCAIIQRLRTVTHCSTTRICDFEMKAKEMTLWPISLKYVKNPKLNTYWANSKWKVFKILENLQFM